MQRVRPALSAESGSRGRFGLAVAAEATGERAPLLRCAHTDDGAVVLSGFPLAAAATPPFAELGTLAAAQVLDLLPPRDRARACAVSRGWRDTIEAHATPSHRRVIDVRLARRRDLLVAGVDDEVARWRRTFDSDGACSWNVFHQVTACNAVALVGVWIFTGCVPCARAGWPSWACGLVVGLWPGMSCLGALAYMALGASCSRLARARRALRRFDRQFPDLRAEPTAVRPGARHLVDAHLLSAAPALLRAEALAAAATGDVARLRRLEELGADFELGDDAGRRPLAAAIAAREVGSVRFLAAPGRATPRPEDWGAAAPCAETFASLAAAARPGARRAALAALPLAVVAACVRADDVARMRAYLTAAGDAAPRLAHDIAPGEQYSAAQLARNREQPQMAALLEAVPRAS